MALAIPVAASLGLAWHAGQLSFAMHQPTLVALLTVVFPAAVSVGSHDGYLAALLALPVAAWGGAHYVGMLHVPDFSPSAARTLGAMFGSIASLALILLAAGGCCGSMH